MKSPERILIVPAIIPNINFNVLNLPDKSDCGSFIRFLKKRFEEIFNPDLKNGGSILRHLAFSFYISTTYQELFILILVHSKLDVLILSNEIALISGNLEVWKTSITNLSVINAPISLRLFLNEIQNYFDRNGLGQVFEGFRKKKTKQGYYLEKL